MLYSYYDIIFSRLTTIDREIIARCIALLNHADSDRWKEVIWSMENIPFASAYMRLIFGLEVEYLSFSDFRINIEKNCTLSKSITESDSDSDTENLLNDVGQMPSSFHNI
jgi:hypothetical protein